MLHADIKFKIHRFQHGEKLNEVHRYISKRYPKWLDYSNYHCSRVKMEDEATDVLNEVILSLLNKDEGKIEVLYRTQKGKYRELDFFVLKMINLNVYSDTSPYQYKYRRLPVSEEFKLKKFDIIDEDEPAIDLPEIHLKKIRLVRYIFERLQLTDFERNVFKHRFFFSNSVSDWPGHEARKSIYSAYWTVSNSIQRILVSQGKVNSKVEYQSVKNSKRVNEIVNDFLRNRTIYFQKKTN